MFCQKIFFTLNSALIQNVTRISSLQITTIRHYAKPSGGIPSLGARKGKIGGKSGPILEKKVLPVETDSTKLVNYLCGSNVNKTGEDIKLKEDHEYPDWLWTLNTGRPQPLEDLDPETDYYWYRVRKSSNRRSTRLLKLKKF